MLRKLFCDTFDEWHSLVIGFCEVMCPWPAREGIPAEFLSVLEEEYPYYVFGRVLGMGSWILIILGGYLLVKFL